VHSEFMTPSVQWPGKIEKQGGEGFDFIFLAEYTSRR
jgi:hypothetical protein